MQLIVALVFVWPWIYAQYTKLHYIIILSHKANHVQYQHIKLKLLNLIRCLVQCKGANTNKGCQDSQCILGGNVQGTNTVAHVIVYDQNISNAVGLV